MEEHTKIVIKAMFMFVAVSNSSQVIAYDSSRASSSQVLTQQQICQERLRVMPQAHLEGGTGPNACSFKIPPPSFDPYTASPEELRNWGFLFPKPFRAAGETTKVSVVG